MIFKVITIVEG